MMMDDLESLVRRRTTITVRRAAKRLGLTQEQVEDLAEQSAEVQVNVAFAGLMYDRLGDCVLEWVGECGPWEESL